ncbi:MAG: hypothetical protein KDK91_33790, partial [Gammaproteobacteria bacterium]|nr:hypothetical protein [Gammaproteobacteria bacterium]
ISVVDTGMDDRGPYLHLEMLGVQEDLQALLSSWIEQQSDSFAKGMPSGADRATPGAATHSARVTDLDVRHTPIARFELRRDVHFHDGHPLDAEDVLFTYNALMLDENLSPRRSDFEPIEQLRILDPYRLEVHYKDLYSQALAIWTIGILPAHRFTSAGTQATEDPAGRTTGLQVREHPANATPIGTGPFKFVSWLADERISLQRFREHWQHGTGFDSVHIRIVPDTLSRELEFQAGAADVYTPEPHQVSRYRTSNDYQLLDSLRMGYTFIGYNLRRPPFDDVRVRQALGMAVNVDELVEYVLFGEGVRVTGPYPVSTPYYPSGLAPLPYDPQQAVELLEQAGFQRGADGYRARDGRPLAITLITNNGNPRRKAILSVVQNAWKRIGVRCETRVFEWSVFLGDYIDKNDFDAVVLGWVLGVDPDQRALWHSSQTDPKELNFVGYSDPEVDRWLDAIRRTSKLQRQIDYTHRIHKRIAEAQPYTFLFAPRATYALDKRIEMVERDAIVPVRAAAGDVYFFFEHWLRPGAAGPYLTQ